MIEGYHPFLGNLMKPPYTHTTAITKVKVNICAAGFVSQSWSIASIASTTETNLSSQASHDTLW